MKAWIAAAAGCLAAGTLQPAPAAAHGGGLNAEGCHNDRRNGGYHCHRSGSGRAGRASGGARSRDGVYPNCAGARAAGATPVMRGDPGYGTHLDRDNDGIGCE